MNERTVFMTALDKGDPAERTAYLDEACGGDAVLRGRVEALLRSHEQDGAFLDVRALKQLAEPVLPRDKASETQGESAGRDDGDQTLDFLAPSDQPGSLGRLG